MMLNDRFINSIEIFDKIYAYASTARLQLLKGSECASGRYYPSFHLEIDVDVDIHDVDIHNP